MKNIIKMYKYQMNYTFSEYIKSIGCEGSKSRLSVTYRNVISYNGYDFDVCKSALQKYIRRGRYKKACYIVCELDIFRFFEGGKSSWTNFFNRLRVISLEDIGIACPDLLITLDKLLENWKSSSGPSKDMLIAVKLMCRVPHSRLYSHLKSYFLDNPPDFKSPNFSYDLGRDIDVKKEVDSLIWCLENKDISAIYWILKITEKEKLLEKRMRSTRSGFLIFDILKKMKINSKVLDICVEWYKTLKVKENFLCCVHPIYCYILKDKIPASDIVIPHADIKMYSYPICNIVLRLDDYVYDMHTKKGRKLGRDKTIFGSQGSVVCYDLNILNDPKYLNHYISTKGMPNILESSEFTLKGRAQLVCGFSKQDTYFAKNTLSHNVVVKGPYLNVDTAVRTFEIGSILNLFKGVNIPDIDIKYLIPDLNFLSSSIGTRCKIKENTPYPFIVMRDLMNKSEYPLTLKSSKLWPETEIVDYEKLFIEDKNLSFGLPSSMNEEGVFSLLLQIAIRYIFKIGDFAYRNFLRVRDKVYNLDIDNVNIGNTVKFNKNEINILRQVIEKRREDLVEYLESWLNNKNGLNMTKLILKIDYVENEIKQVIDNPVKMFN